MSECPTFISNSTTNTSTVAVPMPIDPNYTGVYELIEVSGTVSGSATEVYMTLKSEVVSSHK